MNYPIHTTVSLPAWAEEPVIIVPPDPSWPAREIQFRDLLINDPAFKEQYTTLKMELAARIRIIFATNNAHKVEEIQSAIGGSLEVVSLREAGIDIDIPEPHDTLEANATEKSTTIHRLTGGNCFSEDTGLEVAALNGEPGVLSARYAGEDKAFDKNIEKLLRRLITAGAPDSPINRPDVITSPSGSDAPNAAVADRRARFRTVISLIWEGKEHLFEGICNGHILPVPTGEGGFGYDPVFVPEGDTRSFAQMSLEEKNHYSHRRKAADQLVAFLQNTVPGTPTFTQSTPVTTVSAKPDPGAPAPPASAPAGSNPGLSQNP